MSNRPDERGAPTVYVVDDDPQVRKSLCLIVQSVNLNVKSYGSAQEFLDDFQPDGLGCLVCLL